MKRTAEQTEALENLRAALPPGSTVYCVLEHVSRSGMRRSITCYTKDAHGGDAMQYLSGWIARAGIARRYKAGGRYHDGNVMDGCGMDMGFALVYELSHALYPNGYTCVGEHCPANDHNNGDRDRTPHPHPNAGGYALRHRWL